MINFYHNYTGKFHFFQPIFLTSQVDHFVTETIPVPYIHWSRNPGHWLQYLWQIGCHGLLNTIGMSSCSEFLFSLGIHHSTKSVYLSHIFMNGCFHRTRPGDHFPEHSLDLFACSVFVKIGKEQTLVGQNRLQLVFEGLRVTNNNIL